MKKKYNTKKHILSSKIAMFCKLLLMLIITSLFAIESKNDLHILIECSMYGDTTRPVEFNILLENVTTDKYSYQIDWGNGELSDWSEFRIVSYGFSKDYLYSSVGLYICKARVKDQYNNVSDWSKPCTIKIIPNILKWKYQTNDGVFSAPSIGYNREIYFADEDGTIYCLDQNGSLQWQYQLPASIYSSVVIGKNTIYVTTTAGNLYAMTLTGMEKWRYETKSPSYTTPALDAKEVIYIGCDDGSIHSVSPKGKLLWQYKTNNEISGSPVIDKEGTVYIGSDALYAINPKGRLKWMFSPPEEDETYFFASPTIGNDGTIYIGSTEGTLFAITNKGRLKWIAPSPEEDPIRSSSIIDLNDNIYFGDENGILHIKRPYQDIEQLYETDYYIFSAPAIDTIGNIYITSDDGYFYCVNKNGKLLFKYPIAEDSKEIMYSSSPIIADDGTVYVGSWEGNLFAFYGFAPPLKNTWSLYRYNQQNTGYKSK